MSNQFQSQLSNLVQMATLEQLNLMMEQMKRMNCPEPLINKNENVKENVKIKLEPQETFSSSQSVCDRCANYDSLFHRILSKLDKQTQVIERLETKLEEVNAVLFRLDVWGQPCFIAPEPEILDTTSTKEEVTYTHYESLIKEEPVQEVKEPVQEPVEEVVLVEHIKVKVEVIEIDSEPIASLLDSEPIASLLDSEPIASLDEVPHVTLDIKEIEEPEADEEEPEEEIEEPEEDESVEDETDEEEEEEEETTEEVLNEDEPVKEEEDLNEVKEESSEEEVVTDESSEEENEKEAEEVLNEVKKEEEVLEEDETEADEDEEVFEIEIDDVTYFATDEENGILYEMDKNGDVGKKVGIIKDGEPIFS